MHPEPPATPGDSIGLGDDGPPDGSIARRRFGPSQLVLFAAMAALTLAVPPLVYEMLKQPHSPLHPMGPWERGAYMLLSALAVWTLILAAIPLAGGRRGLRRAARCYGYTAAYASAAAMLLLFLDEIVSKAIPYVRGAPFPPGAPWQVLGKLAFPWPGTWYSHELWKVVVEGNGATAAAVVGAWAALALSGAGRRPTGWFDRIGVLMGVLRISGFLVRRVEPYLPAWW
ncbi:hypothetical protein [Paludisphaera mucosa]|uniref:Uncharacterized protein n=1 Tax=Paludisphaera mucosa TaxID=3030827 RepID=A0ABT6FK76_9BACT|nr:hypothetical protein [Paludisphaera mucosa]MDG3007955.1 hypothetical protein [Paludisphaera mucosa]